MFTGRAHWRFFHRGGHAVKKSDNMRSFRLGAYSSMSASVLRVSLGCRAAPGLGCGSRAKPLLEALERESSVAQAWLHRSGTMLCLVWKSATPSAQTLKALLLVHGLTMEEIKGIEREQALKDLVFGIGWYRGAQVDRLSEEEAEVIAARLVRRLRKRLPLPDGQSETLQAAFAEVCRHEFINYSPEPEQARRERIFQGIMAAGRRYLSIGQLGVLQKVISAGYRPISDRD